MTNIHDLVQRGAIVYSNPGGPSQAAVLIVWDGNTLEAWQYLGKGLGYGLCDTQMLSFDISEANGDTVLEPVVQEAEDFYTDLLTRVVGDKEAA